MVMINDHDGESESRAAGQEAERRRSQEASQETSPAIASQAPQQEPPSAASATLPKGWHAPRPGKIPHPTYAPATVALGIAGLLWGLVTTPIISLIGAVLFGIGLASWIGDLRHER
jgi:hypothetical protein